MPPHRSIIALTLTAAALGTSGCAQLTNPYTNTAAAAPSTTAPDATGVVPAVAPDHAASAQQAVRRFTTIFINWKFDTLAATRRRLAGQAAGSLAIAMNKAADQALTDASRRVSNQANQGTVKVVSDPDHDGHFYIITRETAVLGDTRAQTGYFVYTATAMLADKTYKVTSFVAAS
jgi:hypothetical protein